MSPQLIDLLITSLLDTLLMVGVASAIAVLIGIPLGVTLTVTARGAMLENQPVNHVLGAIINATRSVPFVILMVAIIPFTRLVAQTSIGTTAAIVPLSVAAIPFMARIAENAMREVDPPGHGGARHGRLAHADHRQGAAARGAARPDRRHHRHHRQPDRLFRHGGRDGGGGLGDLAIRYGYQRFQTEVMAAVVVVLIVLVQAIQSFGDRLVRRLSHR